MNGIFSHRDNDCKWIEINDAMTSLSEIEITKEYCIVPRHIVEDSLIEDDFLSEIGIDNGITVWYPRETLDYIQNLRANSSRACIWYPEINDKIPTAKSILLEVPTQEKLRKYLKNNITQYPFVRLCTMSPKDRKHVPLYDIENIDDAVDDILKSDRTGNIFDEPFCEECKCKHLFMREKKEYEWEARCFWSRDKLRAVSLPSDMEFTDIDKEEITAFFERYGKYIPYHSTVVDIGKSFDEIELIEFNTFGPDMKATAGNFSWYEDVMILVYSNTPVFRQ